MRHAEPGGNDPATPQGGVTDWIETNKSVYDSLMLDTSSAIPSFTLPKIDIPAIEGFALPTIPESVREVSIASLRGNALDETLQIR